MSWDVLPRDLKVKVASELELCDLLHTFESVQTSHREVVTAAIRQKIGKAWPET